MHASQVLSSGGTAVWADPRQELEQQQKMAPKEPSGSAKDAKKRRSRARGLTGVSLQIAPHLLTAIARASDPPLRQ
jgi:hypothetical protein